MNKRIFIVAIIITALGSLALLNGGCGGGSGKNACLKNPWLASCTGGGGGGASSAVLTGVIYAWSGQSTAREAGREAAATVDKLPVSGATVKLFTMDNTGATQTVQGPGTATTDAGGAFTITGVTEGTNYVVQATKGSVIVLGLTTVTSANYGATVTTTLTTESTFTVQALKDITKTTGKSLSQLTANDVTDLWTLIIQYLGDKVALGTVSLTGVHTSLTTLASEMTKLSDNVAEIKAQITKMTSGGTTDTTPPTVLSFNPAAGATTVPSNQAAFKVIFSESMNPVDYNTQSLLTASGFSITILRSDTSGQLTINTVNALSYGVFSWSQTTVSNDTLVFTLKANTTLTAAGLKTLVAGKQYNITGRTVPTNLTDVAGNPLTTTGIATTGSFTVATTATAPKVKEFFPVDGATNVPSDGAVFKVIFDKSMTVVNFNSSPPAGFSITIVRNDTSASLTINSANALSYGQFSWAQKTLANDTLVFTLKSNADLTTAGLKKLVAGKKYNITSRTVPTNLTDSSGTPLDRVTGIAETGSFTCSP